ncbi:MAG TPA: polyhydroxyalkanoate synthesis regulator DNA-binding domain-containing protein [Phycisphaerae bacterium]|nr:polyhydroxyalkanoate synthesis regulator DNA-binding domain-containing protein [Phycisphaerae bacterium]HNU46029.1 polyhydroxyalkanoate synthesis regulator DNA-binding domain-containing protein [Phycisphaerae bacterium]
MSDQQLPQVLQIKKYPNRRFYDATRSRHVTLQDVHNLVRQGQDVVVTDSRSGTDITNLILLQLILDREEGKVDLLPTSLLTAVLRNEREVLRTLLRQPLFPDVEEVAAAPLSCAAAAG